MSKKIKIERFLEEFSKKHPEEMQSIDTIDPAVFSKIEQNALQSAYPSSPKFKNYFFKSMIAVGAVASIIILFTVTLLLVDTPDTQANRNDNNKIIIYEDDNSGEVVEATTPTETDEPSDFEQDFLLTEENYFNELSELYPNLHMLHPSWLPEGYFFNGNDGGCTDLRLDNKISYYYALINDPKLPTINFLFEVLLDESMKRPFTINDDTEIVQINGTEVYINHKTEYNQSIYTAEYIHEELYQITIEAPLDPETLKKIIYHLE
ncbi:MAG: hypothetical protein KAQ68_09200 [Clostridiales bacterium]|nr:hypothetical protein [Clostridiales bacterium]